ncbi:MAG: GNAT family N-acetyltransferase [Deltaproteobacteria bacterium]|nr:GNAT family N-acetyltransferase [Deltaproteobacteria bacterium]
MPKLYIKKYGQVLNGQTIVIAVREGIFRDNFTDIINDIKFLNRFQVRTILFHNISNRFANRKHFAEMETRLPQTRIIRVPADQDFYRYVLNFQGRMDKIIFLERKFLMDHSHERINALNTQKTRECIRTYRDLIANTNFKGVIDKICRKIDSGDIERVHILPAGKKSIRCELFSIEGSGTMIANNFTETFEPVRTNEDLRMIAGILKIYRRLGFIKPRSRAYLEEHRDNFYIVKIDDILVGCAEKIQIDDKTVELGALAISTKFRNQRVAVFLINAFMAEMKNQGFKNVVSLTANPRLEDLYTFLKFKTGCPPGLELRQARSPDKKMFVNRL